MDLNNIAVRVASESVAATRRKNTKQSKKKVSRPSKKKKTVTRRKKSPRAKNIEKRAPKKTSKPVREIEREDVTRPKTEYSANMDISLSVDFEGNVAKQALIAKLKSDVIAAIESGVTSTARSFHLEPSNLRVKPLKIDFSVNDTLSLDEDDMDF